MSEMKGHFERGRWIEESRTAPAAPAAPVKPVAPAAPAKPAAGSAGHSPSGAPDAHEQIEQAARKAGEDLDRAINAWAESARKALQK